MTPDRPRDQRRPLPVGVRPVVGESAESYIRRLARANHLKPSYLRRHLATPQGSYGPIQPDQLAAVTGRSLPALLQALPDLAERPRTQRRHTRQHAEDEKRRNQARNERYSPQSAGTKPPDYPSGHSNANTTSDDARSSRH
jgi:hypothetical protein